jgi:hypothetical protein
MVVANNKIDDNKKSRQIDDDFNGHGDAAVRREVHRPMEHIQASREATGCRHRASACIISPRRPQWSMILNKTHETLTKHNF